MLDEIKFLIGRFIQTLFKYRVEFRIFLKYFGKKGFFSEIMAFGNTLVIAFKFFYVSLIFTFFCLKEYIKAKIQHFGAADFGLSMALL